MSSSEEQIVEATGTSVEMELRREWWINHGHIGLYGDDGEMQCGACRPPVDFKRAPLDEVRAATFKARMERAADAYEALTAPPASVPSPPEPAGLSPLDTEAVLWVTAMSARETLSSLPHAEPSQPVGVAAELRPYRLRLHKEGAVRMSARTVCWFCERSERPRWLLRWRGPRLRLVAARSSMDVSAYCCSPSCEQRWLTNDPIQHPPSPASSPGQETRL